MMPHPPSYTPTPRFLDLVPSGAFVLLFWTGILGFFNFDVGQAVYNKKAYYSQ
jgi:hypothetical protein